MADNIQRAGINLTLQGEAEYISGLRSINRETQLLANETKLAVAQLGNGASPTKRYTTEMSHLTTQIDQSATATKVLRNRYKELPSEMTKGRTEIERLDKAVDAQRITTVKYHDEIARLKDDGFNHYSKEVQDATKAYNEQKGILTELETELKDTTKAYDNMSEELENMPNEITKATIATQEMINKQQKMQEEYLKSGGVLSGFADKMESSGKRMQENGRRISDLGDSMRWISVGILAAGGAAFSAYTDFEGAMRGAMKTNDEVVDNNGKVIYSYQDLEDGIRGLSKEIPVTSSELAELAEIAGRLQVPTDEVVMFTEVVAKLGETTNLTGEEAAEQLGKFINITGAGTDTTLNLANALVELGKKVIAHSLRNLWGKITDKIGKTLVFMV